MFFFKNKYTSFYTSVISEINKIPLAGTDYVPQGVCCIDDNFLVTCYDYKHENNSIIFIFNDDNIKTIMLDAKIHCGGIAYHKKTDSLFITGSGSGNKSYINRYSGKDVLNKENLSTISVDKVICVDTENLLYSSSANHSSPAYLTIHNDDLYVGNFVNFSHFCEHKSNLKKYRILSNGGISVSNEVIENPFSNTQGMCIIYYKDKEYYLFSRSFGRKRNSIVNICTYSDKFECINTVVFPSMLEQINTYNNGIIAIFESCAKCYSKTCISYNSGIYYIDFQKLLSLDDNKRCFSKGKSLFVSDKNIDIKGNCGQN